MFKKIFGLGLLSLLMVTNVAIAKSIAESTGISPVKTTEQFRDMALNENDKEEKSSARFSSLLFGPLGEWQDLQDQIAATRFNISVSEEKIFPEQSTLTNIQAELIQQENQFDLLTSQLNEFEGREDISETETEQLKTIVTAIQELETNVTNNKEREAELQEAIKVFETDRKTEISLFKTNVSALETKTKVQLQLFQTQVLRVIKNVGVLLGVILFLLLVRWLITRFVKNFCSNVKKDRVDTILFITKVTVNILILFIIFGLLFAQFVNILPLFALVATGFAFALKDSISSFLAWFLIGTENGFRVGDVIKVNDTYGRVKEITPFVTVIRERFDEAESGKICTFPNKYIFEHEIKNYSRFYNFKQCRLTFHLTLESDYKQAKEILRQSIAEINADNREILKKIDRKISRNFKLDPEDLRPYVWVEQEVRGIKLEAKFFITFKDHNLVKHSIEELFLDQCLANKKITFVQ
jgi:small-conductance mechanosensitive channel